MKEILFSALTQDQSICLSRELKMKQSLIITFSESIKMIIALGVRDWFIYEIFWFEAIIRIFQNLWLKVLLRSDLSNYDSAWKAQNVGAANNWINLRSLIRFKKLNFWVSSNCDPRYVLFFLCLFFLVAVFRDTLPERLTADSGVTLSTHF